VFLIINMLYLIGLGIYDEGDISIKGVEILKRVDRIYAELYTSFFNGDLKTIENWVGKRINILDREDLEGHPDDNILYNSSKKDVALLVCGDPLIATTHADILLRANKMGIKVKVIHSSSVYSAIAETGLHIYKFGKTTTLPFPEKKYFPTSPYNVIKENLRGGMHTLILLDIKYEEKRFMTINEGIEILLKMEKIKRENVIDNETLIVGVARLGNDTTIKTGTLNDLIDFNFGGPPHSIIIPANLHFTEEEMLNLFK